MRKFLFEYYDMSVADNAGNWLRNIGSNRWNTDSPKICEEKREYIYKNWHVNVPCEEMGVGADYQAYGKHDY